MQTILISYDLRKPGRNYENLYEYLKSYEKWAKPLESLWLIKTSLSPTDVRDIALEHIDTNDGLFVVDVTNRSTAWIGIPKKVSDWIKENL